MNIPVNKNELMIGQRCKIVLQASQINLRQFLLPPRKYIITGYLKFIKFWKIRIDNASFIFVFAKTQKGKRFMETTITCNKKIHLFHMV